MALLCLSSGPKTTSSIASASGTRYKHRITLLVLPNLHFLVVPLSLLVLPSIPVVVIVFGLVAVAVVCSVLLSSVCPNIAPLSDPTFAVYWDAASNGWIPISQCASIEQLRSRIVSALAFDPGEVQYLHDGAGNGDGVYVALDADSWGHFESCADRRVRSTPPTGELWPLVHSLEQCSFGSTNGTRCCDCVTH